MMNKLSSNPNTQPLANTNSTFGHQTNSASEITIPPSFSKFLSRQQKTQNNHQAKVA